MNTDKYSKQGSLNENYYEEEEKYAASKINTDVPTLRTMRHRMINMVKETNGLLIDNYNPFHNETIYDNLKLKNEKCIYSKLIFNNISYDEMTDEEKIIFDKYKEK